jgi:hypothetical protein
LARLRAVVGGGEARLLLVVGDAGVGKTGLVTEAMWRVAAEGTVVVWGGCLPTRETLPLLAVVDALSELSRIDRGELLENALAETPRYVQVEVTRLLPRRGGRPPSRVVWPMVGSASGCLPRSPSCWARWRSGAASCWSWRTCIGRTARPWTA